MPHISQDFLDELNLYITPSENILLEHTYLEELHERVLKILYPLLNKCHEVNYSERYWRILLAPWLQFYLYVIRQKYQAIQVLLDQGKSDYLGELRAENQEIPSDTHHFKESLKENAYNLQLTVMIVQKLNLAPQVLSCRNLVYPEDKREPCRHWMLKVEKILLCLFQQKKKLIMCSAYFPRKTQLWLMLKSLAKIMNIPAHFFSIPIVNLNQDPSILRDQLKLSQYFYNPFEKLVVELLIQDIPSCFLENYQTYYHHALHLKKQLGLVMGILSANAWHYNEVFKQVAALFAEEGVKLYGAQHGGNYGAILFFIQRTLETNIVDRYFTWGWVMAKYKKKIQPMPAIKLVGIANHIITRSQKDILFSSTIAPRFDISFFYLPPVQFSKYLEDQLFFVRNLSDPVRRQLVFRPHHEDLGWNIKTRLRDEYSELRIEDWSISFLERLKTTRLYVCDHLSTTHIEALAIGMPTILYWDPKYFLLSEEAQPYYNALREVGILFDDPISAAKAVIALYDNVDSWWKECKRQQAVLAIVGQYANRSLDAKKIWHRTLKELL